MPYESDPIALKLNELIASKELYFGLLDFDSLSVAERALIGTWEIVNEVYNGGFSQYFFNSSGEHAKPMVDVLRGIDALRSAELLQSAIVLAGSGKLWADAPGSSKVTEAMPEDVKAQLGRIESEWYDELDNLHDRLFRFLSKHRDQIDAPEEFWRKADTQ